MDTPPISKPTAPLTPALSPPRGEGVETAAPATSVVPPPVKLPAPVGGPMPGPSAIGVQAVLRRRRGSAALPEPVHGPRSKPAGWWELMGLSGTRDGVAKAVNASAIPDRYKTLLAAEIAGLGAQYNLVKLDAHYHLVNGSARLTVTVTPTSGLV